MWGCLWEINNICKTAFVERIVMEKPSDISFSLSSSGGVVLASRDGKIVCENTLDARLDVVFRKKLPEVFALQSSYFFSQLLGLYTPIISQLDISSLYYLLLSSYIGMCVSNLIVNDSLSLSMYGHSSLTMSMFSSYCRFASGSLVRLLHDELDPYGF